MRKLIFFNAILLLTSSAFAADCGRIISASGSVEVLRTPTKTTAEADPPRAAFPIAANDVIRCDDIIITHERSSAVLLIPRGKLAIGANTKIMIAKYLNEAKPDANLIDLFFGQLRSLITKRKPGAEPASKFQVRTPTAVTGVRGTDFFVSYDEKSQVTEQATLEGQVEVTPQATSKSGAAASAPVLVSAGEQVSVNATADAVQVAPISEAVKIKVRSTSLLIEKDADFAKFESVPKGSESEKPKDALYKSPRWIVAVGPTTGKVKHASGTFNNNELHGQSLLIERQKPLGKRSLLMAANLTEIKNHDNGGQIQSNLTTLSFESGIRIWHANKWSPYIKAGLGYLRSEAHILGQGNSWEFVSLMGAVGIDGIFKPFIWNSAGLYAAIDGRLNQTLFLTAKDNPSNIDDGSLNAFLVTLRLGISFDF